MPILEHALLPVRAGQEAAFEAAMVEARPLIAASPGFLGMELRRPADGGSTYLLLVRWRCIEDHRDGFRRSDRYQAWRVLLHGFYDPMPEVRYFGSVAAFACGHRKPFDRLRAIWNWGIIPLRHVRNGAIQYV